MFQKSNQTQNVMFPYRISLIIHIIIRSKSQSFTNEHVEYVCGRRPRCQAVGVCTVFGTRWVRTRVACIHRAVYYSCVHILWITRISTNTWRTFVWCFYLDEVICLWYMFLNGVSLCLLNYELQLVIVSLNVCCSIVLLAIIYMCRFKIKNGYLQSDLRHYRLNIFL